jgi:hypothetical protein
LGGSGVATPGKAFYLVRALPLNARSPIDVCIAAGS